MLFVLNDQMKIQLTMNSNIKKPTILRTKIKNHKNRLSRGTLVLGTLFFCFPPILLTPYKVSTTRLNYAAITYLGTKRSNF